MTKFYVFLWNIIHSSRYIYIYIYKHLCQYTHTTIEILRGINMDILRFQRQNMTWREGRSRQLVVKIHLSWTILVWNIMSIGFGTPKWNTYIIYPSAHGGPVIKALAYDGNPGDTVHNIPLQQWEYAVCLWYGKAPSEPATQWTSCQIRKIAGAHAQGMPGTFSPSPQVTDPGMHHGTCVTHVPWCMPESLTSGFLWNWRRGKRSRHSRRMRNLQFCVSGKRPINPNFSGNIARLMCTNSIAAGRSGH